MKRAIVSVINDLSTDQRVHKHCMMLRGMEYDVLLIGRQQKASSPLDDRDYRMRRMKLPFEKGPFFYASFNMVLFFQLLFRKTDLFFSNDLDTLLPNFLASRIRNKPLIYDSHEFFTEVPELINRPRVQNIWKTIERWILPNLKNTITVNRSIAKLYHEKFHIEMKVVRNIPNARAINSLSSKKEMGLPQNGKLIILQGSGINIDRGAEEAVEAMQYVENATLLILGSGDVIDQLHDMVKRFKLENKVVFRPRMPYEKMMAHTQLADLGLTLDKDTNINYRYSLPNKLFDYIHAGIPTLASNLIEVKRIIDEYEVGDVVYSHDPRQLGQKINEMLESPMQANWKENCKKAAFALTWENESEIVEQMITKVNG